MPDGKCPHCNSTNIVKSGFRYHVRNYCQQYRCNDCHRFFIGRKMKYDKKPLSTVEVRGGVV